MMTNRTGEPSVQHDPQLSPLAPAELGANRAIRAAGLIAGAGILGMAVLAPFGALFAVGGLVTEGDAARTAADIVASAGLFRLGVASLFVVIVLDVVVAWALRRVFAPVSSGLSTLAAWFRLAYAAVFLVAVSQLAGVPDLLSSEAYSAVYTPGQLHAQALQRLDAFTDIWDAGLLLFGAHLLILGWLAYRSGFVPRALGVLIAIAGAGYAFDSLAAVLAGRDALSVSTVTFLGEFLLAVWLVIRFRRLAVHQRSDLVVQQF
jgi:hypothetical protein